MFTYIAIACLLGVAAGAPSYGHGGYAAYDSVSIPRYEFNYAVSDPHTGDNKAQSEYRDGGVVKGSYSLAEPDGTIRVVDYSADPHTGFNAVVKRLGHAVHPQPIKAVAIAAPVAHYSAPILAPASSIVGIGGWGGLGWGGHGAHGIGLGAHGIGLGAHGLGLGAHGLGLGGYGPGLGGHGLGLGGHGLGLGGHGLGLGDYGVGLGAHGHGLSAHGLGHH